jgi:putative ABC transport system permease protein
VTLRTHEIGVRVALGAGPGNVIRLMLATGGRLVAIGLALGLAASVLTADFMRNQLTGITANDPLAFAIVTAVLTIVTLAACYVPARRAGAVDPMTALRRD